ncbi:short-chain dehydrogenase [Pelomonas sp. Root1217]|uniref:SDR family oxidoreductase n=1 Tax=Pelomonas sp. Root1217 TaxID=1736430 RepID=UPI000710FE90|nr:SDR family oxidoreductase [Pelomonas sp. Root1217]KQV53484.1 short-chain dehydrogenase [Pelomonas sp. Root1217]
MNVLIVGASRGLGLEFVRQYRAAGARITATARDEAALERLRAHGARALKLDVADAASVSGLAWLIDGESFDVVVINAGVYGPSTTGLETPTEADFDAVMHTNVLGPMRLLPQIAEALAPGARVAILSSKMGAIGSRASTSGWLYRASKAAVNSVMKDASLALAGKATVISFHPGWVRTDMGGSGADIDASTSIAGMRTVLASVKPADTGSFFNYDGQRLGW